MGHAMCGGIKALLEGPPHRSIRLHRAPGSASPNRHAQRAMLAPPEHRRYDVCEHESVRLSLDNLMTFPWIKTRARDRRSQSFTAASSTSGQAFSNDSATDGAFHPIPD